MTDLPCESAPATEREPMEGLDLERHTAADDPNRLEIARSMDDLTATDDAHAPGCPAPPDHLGPCHPNEHADNPPTIKDGGPAESGRLLYEVRSTPASAPWGRLPATSKAYWQEVAEQFTALTRDDAALSTRTVNHRLSVTLDEIDAQRAKGWPDFDAEDFCHRCGGRNVSSWSVESDRWNVATAPHGDEMRNKILCPGCFVALHEQASGMHTTWLLVPDRLTPFRWIEDDDA